MMIAPDLLSHDDVPAGGGSGAWRAVALRAD
jgi:hypothetical protein